MRGISPIVATVLLIAIVVAIGALLYMGVSQMLESSPKGGTVYTVMFDAYREKPPKNAIGNLYFHHYVAVSTPMNWVDAFNYCKERGMFLATPKNTAQNGFLKSLMSRKGWSRAYIGMYQQPGSVEPDGGWKYITGDDVEYDLWAPLQPDNVGGEHVGELWLSGWNDSNALVEINFFCEKIPIGFTVTNTSPDTPLPLWRMYLQVYDTRDGTLLASARVDRKYGFTVDTSSGLVNLVLPMLKCDKFNVEPGGSGSCTFVGVPLKVIPTEVEQMKVCLVGEGLRVCDTVRYA